jgi:rfaE bifunctional protein kinase chain/domain
MSKTLTDSARLKRIVQSISNTTIALIGDLVADEFVYGEISRVSREAPVLILKHRTRTILPGGGANAANNLAELGATVLPVGIVGDDEAGRHLLKLFRRKKIPLSGILKEKRYPTITKTRILAGTAHSARQQVVRIDREPEREFDAHCNREILLSALEYARAADAILVSDYGYGVATPAIVRALREKKQARNLPIVLDSRYRLLEYTGITAATPNEFEVEQALGMRIGDNWNALCSAGDQILSHMQLDSLVITRGRDGMAAFSGRHRPVDIPISGSDEIADVTGAGDTVIATFTAALAAGATSEEAAHLANYAGGIVVMKRGTATVSQTELLRAIEAAPPVTRPH